MSPAARPLSRRRTRPEAALLRTEQRAENRRKIVEAASELFATIGYEEASTKAIARRAGVAVGTLFKHAPDKEELLFLVMHDRLAGTVERAFARLPRKPLLDQLLHVFGALHRLYGAMPAVARPFLRATPGAKGPNAEQVNALTFTLQGRLGTLVRAAQERGEIAKDVDPFLLVQNLFALHSAGLLRWVSDELTLEEALEPGLREALALQLRGLQARRVNRGHPPGVRQ